MDLFIDIVLDGFKAYENEDDATKDLAEFSLANAIFSTLVENHACEQSSRYGRRPFSFPCESSLMFYSRNAMDNASKNATDMIGMLQMQYNRGRQAAITNELVDIITGMSPFPHVGFWIFGLIISLFFFFKVRARCRWARRYATKLQ